MRFVLRFLRDRLIVGGLVGDGIDLGEHEALSDVLAFGEGDLDELAVDLRAHRYGVERLCGADAVEIDRHIGGLRSDREHRHRLGRARRCRPSARAALGVSWARLGAVLRLRHVVDADHAPR